MQNPDIVVDTLRPAGIPLRVAASAPGEARATIVVLQGRGEMLEKYRELFGWAARHGFAALSCDWRGQGGSGRLLADPRRGHVGRFMDYVEDLDALLAWGRERGLPPARLAIGHSLGGHIALRALGETRLPVAAAVLLAPMLDIETGRIPRPAARLTAAVAARGGFAQRYVFGHGPSDINDHRFERNGLTSSPERFAMWQALMSEHEAWNIGGATFGWLDAAFTSIARIFAPGFLERIATPVLVLQAGRDRIVRNGAQDEAVGRLPAARLLRFDDALHDILLERDEIRDAALAAIRDHLEAAERTAPASAGVA